MGLTMRIVVLAALLLQINSFRWPSLLSHKQRAMVGPAPQQQTLARDTSSVVISAKKKNKLFSDDF
jgi:hypothetical protein